MKKITREEFYEIMKELVETRNGYKCNIMKIQKAAGCAYTGLIGTTEKSRCQAVANLDDLYEEYCETGADLCMIADEAYNIMSTRYENVDKICEELEDYENVKKKLFITVANIDRSREYLKDKVYESVTDIAIVPRILFSNYDGFIASSAITITNLESYGISAEKLMEDAKKNAEKLFPPTLMDSNDVIKKILENAGMPEEAVREYIDSIRKDSLFNMYILTTKNRRHASAMFYSNVLESVRGKFGNFYIIPSSVEEVLIIPNNIRNVTGHDIREILHSVNGDKNVMTEDLILSQNVFLYDGELKMLVRKTFKPTDK